MKYIEVDKEKLTVTLRKKEFSGSDVFLFRCYNLSWKPNGEIVVPVRSTTKRAMNILLNNMFPSYTKLWEPNYVNDIHSQIKECYDLFESGFDKAVKDKGLFKEYDKLFAHQKEGVRAQCYREFTILSFEQGLGKTVTSLVPSLIMNSKLTLIIVPATLKYNWVQEMTKVWSIPKNQITVLGTKNDIADNERFIIINYEMVEKYFETLISKNISRMIIDECHYIKNRDSKRTRLVKSLRYKLGCKVSFLSGTPSPNKIVDIFSYLEIANHPHGQSYRKFLNQFCYTQESKFGTRIVKGKNIELLSRDMQNLLIRKLKINCLDLPPKNYIKVNFESEEYNLEYNEIYNKLLQELMKSGGGRSVEINSQLNTLQIITAKAKVKPTIELAENIMEQETSRVINGVQKFYNKKVIITCNFVQPLKMLAEYFKVWDVNNRDPEAKAIFIHGGINPDKRMPLVDEFKNNPNLQVLIGQTTCIGVGLNITECSDVIFLNFPYTRAEIEQLVDRTHRIGQVESVTSYFTVLLGKIDEMIYDLVVSKYRDISYLIDNKVDNTETVDVGEDIIDDNLFSKITNDILNKQLVAN